MEFGSRHPRVHKVGAVEPSERERITHTDVQGDWYALFWWRSCAILPQHTRSEGSAHTPPHIFVSNAGSLRPTRRNQPPTLHKVRVRLSMRMHTERSSCCGTGAFPQRTNAEQRRFGHEYLQKTSANARKTFVRDKSTRWSELSRLPYFDLVRQIVIDPMHCLYLGMCCTGPAMDYAHCDRNRACQDPLPCHLGPIKHPAGEARAARAARNVG